MAINNSIAGSMELTNEELKIVTGGEFGFDGFGYPFGYGIGGYGIGGYGIGGYGIGGYGIGGYGIGGYGIGGYGYPFGIGGFVC